VAENLFVEGFSLRNVSESVVKRTASACVFEGSSSFSASRDSGNARDLTQMADSFVIRIADSTVEHCGRGCALKRFLYERQEVLKCFTFNGKYKAGFGAELSNSHGDGGFEAFRELGAAFAKGARQEDQWVEAAHFRKNRDRFRPGVGSVKKSASSAV